MLQIFFHGLGLHAFFLARVHGGLRHLGSRMKQHAKVAWNSKGKVRSLMGSTFQEAESSKSKIQPQTEAGAVVKEFCQSMIKKSMARLEDMIKKCPRK